MAKWSGQVRLAAPEKGSNKDLERLSPSKFLLAKLVCHPPVAPARRINSNTSDAPGPRPGGVFICRPLRNQAVEKKVDKVVDGALSPGGSGRLQSRDHRWLHANRIGDEREDLGTPGR